MRAPIAWLGWTIALGVGSAHARESVAAASPVAYDFAIALDTRNAAFTLDERIDLTVDEAPYPDELMFQVYANVNRPTAVTFVRGSCVPACDVRFEAPAAILVKPRRPLAQGDHLAVRLTLRGTLEAIAREQTGLLGQATGSLASMLGADSPGHFGLLARSDNAFVLSNFYAVLARRHGLVWERIAAPAVGDLCSDDVADYHATVDVPARFRVVSNGEVTASAASPAPTARARRFEVRARNRRDFMFLATATMHTLSRKVGEVTVESHFEPSHRAAGERVLDVAAQALAIFERRFGPYPYARLTLAEAALVGGAGGVEFSGLALLGEQLYGSPSAGGSEVSSLLAKLGNGLDLNRWVDASLEFVTAHEVAHQWWHVLVGSDSRWHPWQDESLAQFASLLYLEDRYGAAHAERAATQQLRMPFAMMRTLGEPDRPVDQPVTAFASSLSYGAIVYGKGPFLLREIRTTLGDSAFFAGLQEYVAAHRMRSAAPGALIASLARGERASEVRRLKVRWLDEAHADSDLGSLDLASMLASFSGGGPPDAQPIDLPRTLQELLGRSRTPSLPSIGR